MAHLPFCSRTQKRVPRSEFRTRKSTNLNQRFSDHGTLSTDLPTMQPLFIVADANRSVEEFAQAGFGEQFLAWAVGYDAPIAH